MQCCRKLFLIGAGGMAENERRRRETLQGKFLNLEPLTDAISWTLGKI
jgi:hypothetical protein